MQITFDPKTREVTLKFSINPASTEPSSTGKTFKCGSDRAKIDADGQTVTVAVNAYRAIEDKPKKGKK